jgi:competence protein ComFC
MNPPLQPTIASDWSRWWSDTRHTLSQLIFAPSCALCRAPRPTSHYPHLCAACAEALPRLDPPFCRTCGEWFVGQIIDEFRCGHCVDLRFSFSYAIAPWRAVGTARELIHRFKYHQSPWLAPTLAMALSECLTGPQADPRLAACDEWALVPVPLHARRFRERSFNQAEELCRQLTLLTGYPTHQVLRRCRYTTAQAQLSRDERWRNLSTAFVCDEKLLPALQGKNLLLIDDVFTTGATAEACSALLKKHFPHAQIVVLTVARG